MSSDKLLHLLIVVVLATTFTEVSAAQTFTILHSFSGQGDGAIPRGVIRDADGNLYGTTSYGGSAGHGTVFKLQRAGSGWVLSTLYAFKGGTDGARPVARVVFGPDNVLYGTTTDGGQDNFGTVFSLSLPLSTCPAAQCPWTHTVLHQFNGFDGAYPAYADLLFDSQGSIYGTTSDGGPGGGSGTVYQLTGSGGNWTESVLYTFQLGGTNSFAPYSGVIFDAASNLYGTASGGGDNGDGAVYELVRSGSGWIYDELHAFDVSDGAEPTGGLIFDSSGNLFGTTPYGGAYGDYSRGGTAFELSPDGSGWTIDVLHSFPNAGELPGPLAGLTMDAAENLYGSALTGCAFGHGCVFKLAYSGGVWNYSSLYDFTGGTDGGAPLAVVLDGNGNLYGVASCYSEIDNCNGTVWEITP